MQPALRQAKFKHEPDDAGEVATDIRSARALRVPSTGRLWDHLPAAGSPAGVSGAGRVHIGHLGKADRGLAAYSVGGVVTIGQLARIAPGSKYSGIGRSNERR